MDLPKPKVEPSAHVTAQPFARPSGDPYELALRDLRRKRAEIDAAIEAILLLRPDLRGGREPHRPDEL
jgi:hypothetical protein